MTQSQNNLLERLAPWVNTGAPSGFESPLAELLLQEKPEHCTEQYIDHMGNLIRRFPCGKEQVPLLLLDAHMDEIGFIITGYDGAFLKFVTIGGVDPRMLPARSVRILTDPPIQGIITCGLNAEQGATFPADSLRIDTGLTPDSLKQKIPVGTPAVYEEHTVTLGNRQSGKAMDDRSCYLILLRAMELAPPQRRNVDVVVVGSVQEEVGALGAITAAYSLAPDACIAVDVTHGSTPDGKKYGTFPLGSGPAIGVGPNMAPWMVDLMKRCAEENDIPYGLEVMTGNTGTNGWEMQISREGIPTGILSLPLRYMHTPVEVFDWKDLEHCAELLAEVVCAMGEELQP